MIASPSTSGQSMRPKLPVSPAVSRVSNGPQQPELPSGQAVIIDLVDDGVINLDNDEIIQYTPTAQRRRPLRATTSVPRQNKPSKNAVVYFNDENSNVKAFKPPVTDRVAVRQEIENTTAAKRRRFFIEKKDYFLPLLPTEHNYIKKLVDAEKESTAGEQSKKDSSVAYEELKTQPRGVKATMKSYQLSGLSFLVYLHRNGLSGILGDEMGLGKTLQTLSLIQHLKENEPKRGQIRPFLVICPLSVLSSWMAESRKWTPGLKVIRFHGPAKERDRVKKIASGEIDFYGNLTTRQKNKLKGRRTASGKPIIDVDSASDYEEEPGVDVVVATYESYQKEQGWFKRAFVWRYVVLDEGHKIKNDLSLISKALQGLQAEYRLILTGTPVQNNLAELWALLHWLYPEVFIAKTSELFAESFNLSKGQVKNDVLDASRSLLELIMLRRMKASNGVNLNLPPKTEVVLFVPLSPMQRFWYTRLITRADQGLLDDLFKDAKSKEQAAMKDDGEAANILTAEQDAALKTLEDDMLVGSDEWKESRAILQETLRKEEEEATDSKDKSSSWRKLMNLLMQLRKVCNHPYQIQNAEPTDSVLGDHLILASGKFIVLEKLVKELVVKQKKKILIFSDFTRMLDLVEDFLAIRGGNGSEFRVARLDGSTSRARRNLAIRLFNDLASESRVMLISTRAGGLGINLTSATEVIFLDQDWNPQITVQAEARAHRIGQTKPVTIYKLVSQGTVEEQMLGRIQKKLYLSAKVTESLQDIHTKAGKSKKGPGGRVADNVEDEMPQLSTGQLMSLVRRGTSAISRPEIDVNEMMSWDWATTVEKCKDQPADINVKKDTLPDSKVDEEEEAKWLGEMERVEAHVFEGKKLARAAGNGKATSSYRDIADEFNRADRRIGKNTTVMVDGFAISKESMNCKDWEAVPTYSGKDTRLAEPKRPKKAPITAQSHCQVCLDGGNLSLCNICPRAFHFTCLNREFQSKTKGWQFNCPQHQCADCDQKTTDAGGMLYRCRWCERAFCEDCLDFEKTSLIGDNTKEYELLGYYEQPNAFYVQCHKCTEHFAESPEDMRIVEVMAADIDRDYERAVAAAAVAERIQAEEKPVVVAVASPASRAGSLSDGTTIETPGVATPVTMDVDDEPVVAATGRSKRKSAMSTPVRMEVDEASLTGTGRSKRRAAIAAVGSIKKLRLE
ncbi:hypothetical protein V496_01151 [Pseudogymnoascus sp. VKM F-4515 (FW-2607)]|nr:hypothetical protein V496_01151 [Pseudogymnoascus sp. VKM F-4515 (FW-2607)]KFY85750.1 hypothetical protein V498_07665 [Pseudogymnoascus sp. VKM F-4517 (FW-2822)]